MVVVIIKSSGCLEILRQRGIHVYDDSGPAMGRRRSHRATMPLYQDGWSYYDRWTCHEALVYSIVQNPPDTITQPWSPPQAWNFKLQVGRDGRVGRLPMPIGFCILFDPTLGFFQTGRGSKIESEWRGTKTLVFNNYSQARRSLTNLLDRSHPEKNIAGAVTVNGRHVPKDG